MNLRHIKIYFFLSFLALSFTSCKDKWDEHNEPTNPVLAETLLQQIAKDPNLSSFRQAIVEAGLDSLLNSSKPLTVWAPTNDALATDLTDSIRSDKAKLRYYLLNHVANAVFFTTEIKSPYIRIKTLNGKNLNFATTNIDEVPLVEGKLNQYTGNGVLHVISKALSPQLNAWEYLMSTKYVQKQVLTNMNYSYRDTTKAKVIGYDPKGQPIFQEGSGIMYKNRYLNRPASPYNNSNIANEDSLYTYIILTDDAYQREYNKLQEFYDVRTAATLNDKASADSTADLTRFAVIKDLAFKGIYNADNFPATLYSTGDSVKFHLDRSAIVSTRKVSNGIVYVMSSINYELTGNGNFDKYTKLKPINLEAEDPTYRDFQSTKTLESYSVRISTGERYFQVLIQNHGVASYWVRYKIPEMFKMKYRVLWRSTRFENISVIPPANDITFYPMRVAFKTPTTITPGFPYVDKPGVLQVYDAQQAPVLDANGKPTYTPDLQIRQLGEYVVDRYYSNQLRFKAASALPIFLVSNNVTTNGANTLQWDCIKLVPVL